MHRPFLHLSVNVPFKSRSAVLSFVPRGYCSVDNGRKTKVDKLVCKDVPESTDPQIPLSNQISIVDCHKKRSASLINKKEDSINSGSWKNTNLSEKKDQGKCDNQDCAKTLIEKPAKSRKSISVESVNVGPEKMPITERYGNSINVSGMKPLSVAKNKTTVTLETQPAVKTNIRTLGAKIGTIVESEKSPQFFSRDCIDFTDKIPKFRLPSFKEEKSLDIPSEWPFMSGSWTPSQEFLDSILKSPIEGLEKFTDIEERNSGVVSAS